jgi:hypothetical protein
VNSDVQFFVECHRRLKKIADSKDDGMYAKMYATDVDRLLRIIENGEVHGEAKDHQAPVASSQVDASGDGAGG